MSILKVLASSKDGLSAAHICARLGWTHEQTYAALVALESRRAARVIVDFTDGRLCSGLARWDLMPAGTRLLLAGLRESELETA